MKHLACLMIGAAFGLPAAAQIPVKIYGQELIDEAVAAHPELLVAMMHVKPPMASDNIIIASNIGRLGKLADEDDMRVIDTGKSNLELAAGGTRFEVELVLQDVTGATIGALGLVFPFKEGADKAALEKRAGQIRDAMRRHISTVGDLMLAYPSDPAVTTKTHAAKLVEQLLARHRDLLSISVQVKVPGRSASSVLASSFGRLGTPTSEADLAVLKTGEPIVRLDATAARCEAVAVLQDKAGSAIGVLNAGFAAQGSGARGECLRAGMSLRDELAQQITSLEKLVALDP